MLWTKPFTLHTHKVTKYMYFCDKTHPLGDCSGIVAYHRHVASEKLGRWLTPDEHVHHKDRDRQNNEPDNLEVLTHAEHSATHRPTVEARVCPSCQQTFTPECNKITFCSAKCAVDCRTGEYDLEYVRRAVWEIPSCVLAKQLGVSDTGLVKICKRNGIPKPSPGYWAKLGAKPKVHTCKRPPRIYGLVHGTNTGYTKHSCRCRLCTEAHRVKAATHSSRTSSTAVPLIPTIPGDLV